MSLEDFTDYKLPKNAYLTFDADSLKSLIIERLNENETFTDQNFEGSNMNAFILTPLKIQGKTYTIV